MIDHTDQGLVTEERIRALAAAILPHSRPSFHAFEYGGEHLVYDLLTGSVLAVSEPFYEILAGIEGREEPGQIRGRLADYTDREVDVLLDELGQLHAAGLLRTEDVSKVEEIEELVAQSLIDHKPRKMMLMVQSNCNLKCTYCYEVQSGFHSTGTRMDYETGVRSVEFLIERSGKRKDVEITFFGGEPLMNFKLIQQLVDYCKTREVETGKTFYYQITTNGTLMSDEVIRYLVEHEFSVMLSMDGEPELNDVHRVDLNGNGTGERALEAGKRLVQAQRAAGQREAMVRVTLTRQNSDGFAAERFLRSQGFRRVMIGASTGRAGERTDSDLGPTDMAQAKEDVKQATRDYVTWLEEGGQRPEGAEGIEKGVGQILQSLTQPNANPSIRCGVGRNMQAITREGNIYPCHRYAGEDEYLLGNLETGLDQGKVRSYYERLLEVKEEHCSKCWARITCGGQCPWHISSTSGEILHPEEDDCNGIRGGHERLLYLAHKLKQAGAIQDLRDRLSAQGSQAHNA